MATNRDALPQRSGKLFLTDAGIETTLIFLEGRDLPLFAAFDLLRQPGGEAVLEDYYRTHAAIARRAGVGFILESATWRASSDWGERLGYPAAELDAANERAVELLHSLREELQTPQTPMVVSGCIGPRGDGYDPGRLMGPDEAADYHSGQARTFALAGADQITAITMTNAAEAIGVARAAETVRLPSVISFTVETDGRLPTGQPLAEAISEVDETTARSPAYYMINCAHPTHFAGVLDGSDWMRRVRGIRANASRCSHAELDNAPELDAGDPDELAALYAELRHRYPWINVLGGCCGTDHRHIARIAETCHD
jgi:S-methylmethionine-dependent homocysteine/selenocysteine methylase